MTGALDDRMLAARPPTERQLEILSFIAERVMGGETPTWREIGLKFGMASTNAVNDHLNSLERRGLISRADLKSRTIALTDAGLAALGLRRCEHCHGGIRS